MATCENRITIDSSPIRRTRKRLRPYTSETIAETNTTRCGDGAVRGEEACRHPSRPGTPWPGQMTAMTFRSRSSGAEAHDAPKLVEARGRVAAGTAHTRTTARAMKMHSEPPSVSAADVPSASTYQQRSPATTRAPRRVPPARHREAPVASPAVSSARGADYVTIPVAAVMTGSSPKAIRRKIVEAGVWLEGREFRRAPDGHVLIGVKGYELRVESGRV